MRIAFDYHVHSLLEYGGIARYVSELARELAQNPNHEVGVIAPLYSSKYLRDHTGRLRIIGVGVPRFRKTGRALRLVNRALAPRFLRMFGPGIVHETGYASFRSAPRGVRVVLTVYDMIHERCADLFSPRDRTPEWKRLAIDRADHVICISESTRRDVLEMVDIGQERTSVVHLGFNAASVPTGDTETRAGSRPFILYVGARSKYKNFEGALEGYAQSLRLRREVDFLCFGGGPPQGRERDLRERLRLGEDRIRFVSGGDAELSGLYREARALVYPSLYEGFGVPLLEAMAHDCPVAASATSSIPEVAGDAAVLFDPSDTHAMSSAMERVVFDEETRRSLTQRGRERVKAFSWGRCAAETLKIYQKVVEG